MIAIGLLIAPPMQHRIMEREEDSDHSHFAVIEMSPESWKLEADEADILRASLAGRGEHVVVAGQRRGVCGLNCRRQSIQHGRTGVHSKR